MASSVDICNLALARLGTKANVTSIDPAEGSAEAGHCSKFYPIARDCTLEEHHWGFATVRKELAELSVTPPALWTYAYALPSDYLKAQMLLMDGSTEETGGEDFVIESLESGAYVLYTNATTPILKYTRKVMDSTKFSPLFVSAMSFLLASYLAGPVTKDPKIGQQMYNAYMSELGKAESSDSNAQKLNAYKEFTPGGIQARA